LEEVVSLRGLPFLLIDTAGMRRDDPCLDMAEREGLERAFAWMAKADLLLVLVDVSEPLGDQDRMLLQEARGRRGILVMNKIDLFPRVDEAEVSDLLPGMPWAKISARNGTGLPELKEAMVAVMERGGLDMSQDLVITRLHHRQSLERAQVALSRGQESLANGLSPEFVSLDLRECLDALGEITGETTSEDVLNEIFSRFCIGK
jgi:tRNA modification GTPase